MKEQIESKLPNVGTTIFSVMSKMANDNGAINLSQGFPDFEIDPKLSELVYEAMKDGFNQYCPMPGLLALREAIAKKLHHTYNLEINPETDVVVTAGATQAIFTAISALIHPGDEVILFAPAYDCYAPAIELQQARPVFSQLRAPDYRIDWEDVKTLISDRTKMIMINSPHNPSGTVLDHEDMLMLQQLASEYNLLVLSDEVYEHIVFDDKKHLSVSLYPELYSRSLAVASFGKTFHVTGWKAGYIYGPSRFMDEFRKVHQYNVFCVNTPVQVALSSYVSDPENYEGIPDFYQKKRDTFLNAIDGSRFKYTPSSGTYFQVLNYQDLSGKHEVDFARELTETFKVASIPLSVFYQPILNQQTLRFCFAKNDQTLVEAGEKLKSIF